MKFIYSLELLFISISAIGCSSKERGDSYNKIESEKASELVNETKQTLVIDVRDAESYEKGHLANAVNIPFDELEGKISDLEGYKDQTVAFVCNTGNKSGKATQMFVDKGFTKVYNVEGGMEGYDYDTATYTNVTGSEFEKLVKENKDAAVLDLRDAKDFKKSSLENAVNISIDEFETKSAEQLKDKKQEILLYCNTGTKASKMLEEKGYTNVVNSVDGVKEYEFNLK